MLSSAMDSQITLVNPAPPVALVFNMSSTLNTTLFAHSKPMYRVRSDRAGARTDIYDIQAKSIVGTIKRKEVFSDTVTFPHRNSGKPIKVRKWLRSTRTPGGFSSMTLETESGLFIWRLDTSLRLVLYREDDLDSPISYVKSSSPNSHLILVLKSGSEDIREEIIVSFLILEQKLRVQEKIRRSEAMYGPMSGRMILH
ncbi:hypothetical protein BDQ12DRAFT_688175 [Crucibulum laeve]|uniref:DUF6593 domain-containing protein n=1 Tax=Crucibulum laeve TaxID=68775 RepID=A0A5C3LRN5_9AGAR|nr:hypothetical protein BDQ12DRAFT_688175 [Crucibulum laeve]